ncbi:MAG TPA: Type 1 glutamine amidotransferase-like domain-containing protein [Candidatus Saccharimonadales bacterium]|nr:Type 1 glutamine amidotransferase-like domain-containing protein [Candidatus Saccharimonadales bacterium]
MTKYVLNSGNTSQYPDKQKTFFTEILKDLGTHPKILIVLFSRPREYWEETFQKYESATKDALPDGIEAIFEIAMPDAFVQQVKDTDVVYVLGGDDYLLRFWFDKFDLPTIWEDKVIAGSSAGSGIMVKHFWTCDWRKNMDGIGILPIKFIPHYNSSYGANDPYRGPIDWEQARDELKHYGDKSLPIYAVEEGDFIVIEQ